jgi:hypothetical protein
MAHSATARLITQAAPIRSARLSSLGGPAITSRAARVSACVPRLHDRARALLAECNDWLVAHYAYVREYLQDMPDVRNWVWTAG